MCQEILSSVKVHKSERPPTGRELFIRFVVCTLSNVHLLFSLFPILVPSAYTIEQVPEDCLSFPSSESLTSTGSDFFHRMSA